MGWKEIWARLAPKVISLSTSMEGTSPYIAEKSDAISSGDKDTLRNIQDKEGSLARKAAAAQLGLAVAPQILPVIANPATASTTAGAVAATGLDAAGLVGGLSQLNNYWNNRKNLTWNDTPGIILSGLSLVPGSSQLTNVKNWGTAANSVSRLVKPITSTVKANVLARHIRINHPNLVQNLSQTGEHSQSLARIWNNYTGQNIKIDPKLIENAEKVQAALLYGPEKTLVPSARLYGFGTKNLSRMGIDDSVIQTISGTTSKYPSQASKKLIAAQNLPDNVTFYSGPKIKSLQQIGHGQEHEVYQYGDDVLKFRFHRNPISYSPHNKAYSTLTDELTSTGAYKYKGPAEEFIPERQYLGVGIDDGGSLVPVFKERFIEGQTPTQQQLNEAFTKYGINYDGVKQVTFKDGSVAQDVNPKNVKLVDGKPIIIDPIAGSLYNPNSRYYIFKPRGVTPGSKPITKVIQQNGKIRLRLPSHTDAQPREIVLEPQGNNKFYAHIRTWDGDHIPASNLSSADKQALYDALYNEIPAGGEILLPQSGPGNYATRGTIAGLQRLARDSRFRPTQPGIIQYVDKDGIVKTFDGTGFMKKFKYESPVTEEISLVPQDDFMETTKILEKVANPILRRKLTRQQFTNIIKNNGKVLPLVSEKGSLRFTSAKPRKADFYIETEVPVIKYLPKEIDSPYTFTKGNLSERFQASSDFRPNIYDESVKVFRKNSKGKYELVPKESLDDVNLLSFGINTHRPILTEKPIKLDSHHIHLPEYPTQTSSGFTVYLDEALSPYNQTKISSNKIIEPDLYNTGRRSYYDPKTGNFITPHGSNIGDDINILKSKINNTQEPSDIAKSLISPAKKYYLEKYDIADNALSDDEWARLMQTLLEKNSDKEVLFHSTYSDYFDKVLKNELLRANEGYLGRGFYVSDIPQTDYGPRVIPFTMPKGKQIILSEIQSGQKSPYFLHADNVIADQMLTSLRKPMVQWSKKGFQPKPWGFWPGMHETSKDPASWNQLIKALDLNFVKSTASSKGIGYKYPEILIPENKVDLLEPLFKAPKELKQGGILKAQNGFLNIWQKAYNSKFGKGLRNFLNGTDSDLSDEEYLEKHGYNKPVGSIGILGALVAPEWEGLEALPVAENFGRTGTVKAVPKTAQMISTKIKNFEGIPQVSKVEPVKELTKFEKFLQRPIKEQDDIVRFWNGEKFSNMEMLKLDKKVYQQFKNWINK